MLSHLTVAGFTGVPYLETSALMSNHAGKLKFSTKRPTVIVGPNGSGKSALLTTLAIRFLAYQCGASAFDDKYVASTESEAWWTKAHAWRDEFVFLKGLECKTDNGPVIYYRPNHVPGNETSIAASMMMGYFDKARAYGRTVEDKSSGQANQAMLERVLSALNAEALPTSIGFENWKFGKEPITLSRSSGWIGPYQYKAEELKKQFLGASGLPLILMDEPEQSLDALAEVKLWKAIESANSKKVQVIVATHSLYPLLNPSGFELVEAVPGYIEAVRALL